MPMMQTDHTELKFIGAAFLRMEDKMWWGSEEGQSCGKALSCALEEEEAHGGGRSICDQECQMWEVWKWPLGCSCFGSICIPATSQKH